MYAQQGRKRPHPTTVSKPGNKPVNGVYLDVDKEGMKENVPTRRQKIMKDEPEKCETLDDVETEEEKRQRLEAKKAEGWLFTHPSEPIAGIDSVEVYRKNVERLCKKQWLDDKLISFMINLYALNMLTSMFRAKIWIPTTHFFSKIVETGEKDEKGKDIIWLFDKASRNMRSQEEEWMLDEVLKLKFTDAGTGSMNYFEKKALIIPINHKNEHWMWALILNPGNMISYGNKIDSKKKCHIMVLDSMNDLEALIRKKHVEHILTRWLAFKFQAMNLPEMDSSRNLPINYAPGPSITDVKNLPKQKNFSDCGAFLTDFIGEMFYRESETGFFDRNFDELDWKAVFPKSIAGEKPRQFIFRNVLGECKKNVIEKFENDPYYKEFEHLIQK